MILLNFTHPITPGQKAQIEALAGQSVGGVVERMPHFDHNRIFAQQVIALVNDVNLTTHEWQTLPILVNLPGYAPAAGALLAELHGRMGYFPSIIRLRPVEDTALHLFEVAEILNLQSMREMARKQRI